MVVFLGWNGKYSWPSISVGFVSTASNRDQTYSGKQSCLYWTCTGFSFFLLSSKQYNITPVYMTFTVSYKVL
jgi:hypothetical protein